MPVPTDVTVVRTFGPAGSPIKLWKNLQFAIAPVPGMTLECDGGVTRVVIEVCLTPQTHGRSVRPGIVAYLEPEYEGSIVEARADGWVDLDVNVRGPRPIEAPRAR